MRIFNITRSFTGNSPVLRNTSTLVVLFGILLLCFIWIGLYYKVHSERQIEIDNAIKVTANLARTFEEHTLRTIRSADQAVLFLKYQYEKEGQAIDIPLYVSEGRFASQPFVQLGVIDETGILAATSQVPFVAAKLRDREHFLVHKDVDSGQLYISKPVLGRASGKWSIQMTRRANKPDGTFGGVVVVSVDLFYFNDFYKQIDLGNNSIIALVGRDGIVRARQSGQNEDVGQDISNSALMEKLSVSNTDYYISKSPVDGIKRINSYRALKDYPLVALVGVDEAEVIQSLEQRKTTYLMVAELATIVVVFFITILLLSIRRQKRAEAELKQARDNMEGKVHLRTSELFAANQELADMNQEFQKTNQELEEEIIERRRVEEELRKRTEEIQHTAYTDMLTGLPNRAYLNAHLATEIEKARRSESSGVVMFIDLDDIKTVNDIFGHTRGDILISMAGTRIVAEVGDNAFVARIGGDEFIVILPGKSDREQIVHIADRIVGALRPEYISYGDRFPMSASIGIVTYPADGDTTEEILKNADNAMYAAKRAGKNCWRFYETAMHTAAYEKMLLTNSLRHAIERQEFSLHYQPQIAVAGRDVVGFEALLRWNSQEYGLVSPTRFIPLAEQSGLILPIGQWVLRNACQFAKRLASDGWSAVYVGVNISAKQLVADDFITSVRNSLDEAGIEPRQLGLEITESLLMVSMEDATRKLAELHAMGVRLSLDDFGTGYSSLTYLRHLPVETLKIDKSFIDMIATDVISAKIIGSVINMAHILKMTVVAEGVETEQQLKYLADNYCDCIQGYIFSPPMPEEETIRFIKQQTCLKLD